MRVLTLVTDAFGGHGGIAVYNRNVLRALCEHPNHPEVVALPRLVPHAPEALPDNLDFRVTASAGKARFVAETLRALVAQRFDLIVAGHVNLLPLAIAARHVSRAPLVLFVYGIDAWRPRARWTHHLVAQADACVSIRSHTVERMSTWVTLSRPPYILENAIHLDHYGPGPKRQDLLARYGLQGKRVLLTLSRVDDPHFGIDEVIEVLGDLVREVPDLRYLVVGDGKDMPRIRQKAHDLGVADHVVFAGYVEDADKADHYRLGDAFAMPGSDPKDFDRYPLRFSFLEAMACGLPVVASRPEEHDRLASPIPNINVEPTDRAELKAGLLEALRRGPGGVPPELQRYGYPAFRERLHDIVDEVTGRSTRGSS